nr:tyrosine protein phosphatase non receptor type [Hymenolepis microstoma]
MLYPSVAFDNFEDHVKSLEAEDQMSNLFKDLKNLTTEQERNLQLSVNAASMMESQNRYCDILPYDQSLVILGRKWPLPLTNPKPNVISGLLGAAYVNASFVRRPRHTPTGCAVSATYSQHPDYISTQGPCENTVADFLTMIYQQRVPHIVMLCRNEEDGNEKCARYWPSEPTSGAVETFTSDHHTVTVTFIEIGLLETGVRRVIAIHPHDEKEPWTVTQIQTFVWDDYQGMDMDKFYELLQRHMELNTKYPIGEYGPPVVHCSAGVGRTGTFICGRFLLEQLRKDPSKIDVVGTVLALRRWRMHMVQNEVQLAFLYHFVLYVIEKENLSPTILTSPDSAPLALPPPYNDVVDVMCIKGPKGDQEGAVKLPTV